MEFLNPHLIGAGWVNPIDREAVSRWREILTDSRMRSWEVERIFSSNNWRVSGSVSVFRRDLSSARSLWAVECGLMGARFVEAERVDG